MATKTTKKKSAKKTTIASVKQELTALRKATREEAIALKNVAVKEMATLEKKIAQLKGKSKREAAALKKRLVAAEKKAEAKITALRKAKIATTKKVSKKKATRK